MIGFTRALALKVVGRGITVNTICPGWVDTEMATQGINETAAGVPIKRFLEADKIAELVCYLTLDQANGNHRPSD
jgi:NAD(P)-dependent dehydrogenase (short-subunit alcohol dehydrogenase family)